MPDAAQRGKPALLFVSQGHSGPSRRMDSLVAWIKVTQRRRLRVIDVDADENPSLVSQLDISEIPALVLVRDRKIVGRLEGRVTGRQIDDLIRAHV